MAKIANIDPRDIIEAAKLCVRENGLAATTLKDVARAAGVTQGTVYYHFNTKEELLSAIIRTSMQEHLEKVEAAWESTGEPLSKIDSVLEATLRTYGRDTEFHRLFFNVVPLGLHNERAAEEFKKTNELLLDTIRSNCRQIADAYRHEPGISLDHLSRIILAALNGLALQSLFDPDMDSAGIYDTFKKMLHDLVVTNLVPGRDNR